ncbi:MAG: PrsW family intramembrane metalloprotease [Chloroflexota bacterium]
MAEEDLDLARADARGTGAWWHVLLTALVFYLVGIVILFVTGNPILFPTVVLIGSFMVPASYVTFFYDHRHLSKLSMPTTAKTFLYGGLLGVFAASILEPLFIHGSLTFANAFGVGVIEEFAKIIGILVIARRLRHDSELDGIILGAAAGMGFAALESTGYAFTVFLSSGSLTSDVIVTLLRGVLSPVGHGTWTAILAGVMFRESVGRRFRITGSVILAYVTVVVLHGLWDGLPGVISALFAPGLDVFVAQMVIGLLGLAVLWRQWHEARRLQQNEAENLVATATDDDTTEEAA